MLELSPIKWNRLRTLCPDQVERVWRAVLLPASSLPPLIGFQNYRGSSCAIDSLLVSLFAWPNPVMEQRLMETDKDSCVREAVQELRYAVNWLRSEPDRPRDDSCYSLRRTLAKCKPSTFKSNEHWDSAIEIVPALLDFLVVCLFFPLLCFC